MAKMDFFNNSEVAGQQDLFSMFGIAPATDTAPAADDTDLGADEAEETDAATEETASEKKPASKPAAKKVKKPAKTLAGPVQVLGCGWSHDFGEPGEKYSSKDIIKMAFEAGYKEVAAALVKCVESGNVIYVQTLSESSSDDDIAIPDGVTVILGQKACKITAEDCGVDADELTLFDVTEKFLQINPDFAGCTLKYNASAKVAIPTFEKKVQAKELDSNTEYTVFSSDGNKELTGGEIAAFYEGYNLYQAESGVIFAQPVPASGKGSPAASVVYVDAVADLGLEKAEERKAEEKYKLPLEICLGNWNQSINVTSDDFGGKEKVEKEDILNFLRPNYRAFRSKNRKFDFAYNKATSQLAVMISSGEKGAAAGAAATFAVPGLRVESTPVGIFKGRTEENGDVSSLDFQMKLPRIPYAILAQIIAIFRADLGRESIVQIFYNEKDGYYLKQPEYTASKTRVGYGNALDPRRIFKRDEVLVMTVHSHNTMRAFFSPVDDEDEVVTGLFGVVGRLDRDVEVKFRAGMEGCFKALCAASLFGGGAA